MSYRILAECNVDTMLAKQLGFRDTVHASGISTLLNQMERKHAHITTFGIIDDDKKPPPKFKAYKKVTTKDRLKLYHRETAKGKDHYLIVVSPAQEKYLWYSAEDCGIDPTRFFPSIKRLAQVCKSSKADKNSKLQALINSLCAKPDSPVGLIRQWIHQYSR